MSVAMERFRYDDAIVRKFLLATFIWGLVGMLVGLIAALKLASPAFNLGLPWISFGRLRPLHTNAVIFAFAGNAIFTGIYYSMQRLLKARMFSGLLSALHFWGWQLIIVAAAVTLYIDHYCGRTWQLVSPISGELRNVVPPLDPSAFGLVYLAQTPAAAVTAVSGRTGDPTATLTPATPFELIDAEHGVLFGDVNHLERGSALGQQVRMRQHDTLGIGRRPGGVEDHGRVARSHEPVSS